MSDNLRRLGGIVANPAAGIAICATIPTSPFVFGAKLQTRLRVVCDLVHFYETIGRPLTALSIQGSSNAPF